MSFAISVLIVPTVAFSNPIVSTVGKMRDVMRKGDRSAKVTLADLNKKNLFALGPVEGLNGEITVISGTPFISHVNGDQKIGIDHAWTTKATFLVYSNIENFNESTIPSNVKSLPDLETFIEILAKKSGLDPEKPFPFIIEGELGEVEFHIVKESIEKGRKPLKVDKIHFKSSNANGKLLGFFSKHHQGIFTHHDTFMHVHYVSKSDLESGHVEALHLAGSKTKILLPAK